MARTVEWYIAISMLIIGGSHLLRPRDWAAAFGQLFRLGAAGAFVNGAISLLPAAIILAAHQVWTWPHAVISTFGWLLAAKAAACFLAPRHALRSMERGSHSPQSFRVAGVVALAIGAWSAYCAWLGVE
jgi:hypothetical protein